MKRMFLTLCLVAITGMTTACATTPPPQPDKTAPVSLDLLFLRLQTARTDEEAQTAEGAIRNAWAQSGRQNVDNLVAVASLSMRVGDFDDALQALNEVVTQAPDFAEGWNMRATVYYLRGDYAQSMADLGRVLTLEPRHFGALAGLGRIFLELDDEKTALKAFDAALGVNPHLSELRQEADALREQLAGTPI